MKKTVTRILTSFLTACLIITALLTQSFAALIDPVTNEPRKPANDFGLAQVGEVYISETAKGLYTQIGNGKLIDYLTALPKLKKAIPESTEKAEISLLIVGPSFNKTTIELRPNELRYGKDSYTLSKAQHDRLKNIIEEDANTKTPMPKWLVWMNPNRITEIHMLYNNNGNVNATQYKKQFGVSMAELFRNLRLIHIKSGTSGKKFDPDRFPAVNSAEGAVYFRLKFDSDVFYSVAIKDGKLYVNSSDQPVGWEYELPEDGSRTAGVFRYLIDDVLAYPDDIPTTEQIPVTDSGVVATGDEEIPENVPVTGKPVIYLYPEKTRDVSVKLGFKGELCYTYPAYNDGWNVTASPDGKLINKSDNTEHYYLFWDGNPDFKDWDMSEGFVVAGTDIQAFLTKTLPKLGLTPREYNDFITYWTPILSNNKYNLLSFSTSQYEAVSPLEISPAPDTVLRVHMLYKAIDTPVSVKEQALPKAPVREGFTAIEWGATKVS